MFCSVPLVSSLASRSRSDASGLKWFLCLVLSPLRVCDAVVEGLRRKTVLRKVSSVHFLFHSSNLLKHQNLIAHFGIRYYVREIASEL
jgi:hypothetical protein